WRRCCGSWPCSPPLPSSTALPSPINRPESLMRKLRQRQPPPRSRKLFPQIATILKPRAALSKCRHSTNLSLRSNLISNFFRVSPPLFIHEHKMLEMLDDWCYFRHWV